MRTRATLGVLLAVAAALVCLGGTASSAQAAGPEWTLEMTNSVDPFEGDVFIRGPEPAQANLWYVTITNTGDAPASGPTTFTNILPPGVKLVNIGYGPFYTCCGPLLGQCVTAQEVQAGTPLSCTVNIKTPPEPEGGIEPIQPGQVLGVVSFSVEVLPGSADLLTNEFTLSGGGAPTATVTDSVKVIDTEPFHVGRFEARTTTASEAPPAAMEECCNGPQTVQQPLYDVAGGHPPGTTMNRFTFARYPGNEELKDAVVKLPPGYFGNPAAAPTCPMSVMLEANPWSFDEPACPAGLQNRNGGRVDRRLVRVSEGEAALQRHPGSWLFRPILGQHLRQRADAVCGSAAEKRGIRPDDRVDELGPHRGQNVLRLLLRRAQRTWIGHLGRAVPVQPRQLLGSRAEMGNIRRQLGEPGQGESGKRTSPTSPIRSGRSTRSSPRR